MPSSEGLDMIIHARGVLLIKVILIRHYPALLQGFCTSQPVQTLSCAAGLKPPKNNPILKPDQHSRQTQPQQPNDLTAHERCGPARLTAPNYDEFIEN